MQMERRAHDDHAEHRLKDGPVQPEHAARTTIVIIRVISGVMLFLSGLACFASGYWTCVVVAASFLLPVVATWIPARWAAWVWGGSWSVGLMLFECWQFVGQ